MGNDCCRAAPSSMDWGGEDWDYLKSNDNNNKKKNTRVSSNKVFDEGLGNAQKDSNGGTTVKIRISKKELKELLGETSSGIILEKNKHDHDHDHDEDEQIIRLKKPVGRASAEQVLLRLLKASTSRDDHDDAHHHHTPWKPVLDTIPEVN